MERKNMNTRSLLASALASLALAPLPAIVHADPMPAVPPSRPIVADALAVSVVRQFVADRAAGNSAAAYTLLSAKSRQGSMTETTFAKGGKIPTHVPKGISALLFGFLVLLGDTHNTLGYTFTVLGADPAKPGVVLVRTTPPAGKALPASTVHLVTVRDPATHTPSVDLLGSLELATPKVFVAVRKNALRVMSQNNLKELSLGIIQYEQDHDELAPDAGKWADEIMPYVESAGPFHDPATPASQAYSYAYNRTLSHQSLAVMENPAQTVMLFESNKGVKNASDTGQSVPRPGRHRDQSGKRTGTDYAFADGHVKWYPDGTKLSYRLDGK